MFRLRARTDRHALLKKGNPAHNTTGVARSSSTHLDAARGTARPTGSPGIIPPMAMTSTGAASARPIQKRRVMSRSSRSSSSPAASAGSSAMPHAGQSPGPSCFTSGCIGHVYGPVPGPWRVWARQGTSRGNGPSRSSASCRPARHGDPSRGPPPCRRSGQWPCTCPPLYGRRHRRARRSRHRPPASYMMNPLHSVCETNRVSPPCRAVVRRRFRSCGLGVARVEWAERERAGSTPGPYPSGFGCAHRPNTRKCHAATRSLDG